MELFKSMHEALIFAFNYSTQQYALSPMSKMIKTGLIGSGKGLVSVDGSGQAGMIKAEIDRLPSLYRSCIIARYSSKYEDCKCCGGPALISEYREAVANLAEAAARDGWVTGMSILGMRRGIIQSFFEKKIKVATVADDLGVPRRTAYDQKAKILKILKALDADAQAMIGDGLMPLVDVVESLVVVQAKPPKTKKTVKEPPKSDDDAVVCVKCNGEPAKPAIAFFNTGEDHTEHKQAVVTVECQLCNGAGKISAAVAGRYHRGKQHREARVTRGETLYAASQRLGVSPADLSAYEHGYKDFVKISTEINTEKACIAQTYAI